MLSFLHRISFRGLIGITLGLIGLAVLAVGATIMALREDALRDATNDTANIATVLAEQTERSVQAIDIITSDIVDRFGNLGGGMAPDSFLALLRSRITHDQLVERLGHLPQTDFVALIDRDGHIANSSRTWPMPYNDVSRRDYYIHARDNTGRQLFISDLVRNRITNERNIFFSKRISGPNGEFLGLVLTGIKLSYFQHVYNSITSLRNQSFVFSRTDGTVLVRHPDDEEFARQKIPEESEWYALVAQGGGSFRSPGLFSDEPLLVAVRPLQGYHLVVNVSVSERAILASWRHRAILIAIGTGLALLCSLLLLYALNHQFAQLAASRSSLLEREARLAEKSHELEQANTRIDTAIDNMLQGLVMFDADGKLVVCNKRFIELYNLPAGAMRPGLTLRQVMELRKKTGSMPADIDTHVALVRKSMEAGQTRTQIVDFPDGRTFCITNRPSGDGGWVATHEDITERRTAERELVRARNMLGAVVENIPEMLIVKDAKSGRYIFLNRAGESFLGAPKDEVIGKTTAELHPPERANIIIARDRAALQSGHLTVDTLSFQTATDQFREVISKRVAIRGRDGEPEYLLNVVEDVTERRRNESRIEHLAHHDSLTDLPNRAALKLHLTKTLEGALETGDKFAVLCVDLDRFKEVNDLYGHAAGDSVLLEITRLMKKACGGAFLARLGGDEFMAICVDGVMPAAATALAQSLIAAVSGDIDCEGRKVNIGMSVGIAMFPSDGTDSVTLIRNADAALYRAKAEGRGEIRFFEAEMDRMLHDRRALQADLALSVSRNELQLFYQPQSRISGEIIGFEALLRWDHLRRGFVPPNTFIPLAEETGLINEIGEWVLREACREAASWRKPLQIAINLSPLQLRQGDFVSLVHSVLLENNLAPDRLVLEITEGALMDDYSRAVSILRRVKALGVRIAMDDFGTGYSSLSYLQSFPFDKIKIDQTFISNLDRNAQSAAIVRAVLALGHNLDLITVAEGVETPEQLTILRNDGCNEIQGYLIGRPQPIEEYAAIVGRSTGKNARIVVAG
ncbi:bifunctional diguanylate cyclase/phosphodiesterase [Pseudorhodoplanes sinuspersici]|uniref:bifunctional diguanylate cyclase/phosphodiesterase n=1 Tax=Pseudorhodoplanes sinuspersici TaxID=1235591 RepID=UPI001603C40A|nr:EAL domain-containing protein [Pseudorhodoplanes sinuspersici]